MPHISHKRHIRRAISVRSHFKASSTKWLVSLILAAPIVITGTTPGMAQQVSDCAVLARLAGNWTGRGSIQRSRGAEPEPVRCRLRFEWRPSSRIVSSTMDCRGIDLDFKLWGSISVLASGGKLKGAFYGAEGTTNVTASGRCRGAALMLRLKEIKPKAATPVSSDLTITLSGDGGTLTNLLEIRDPASGDKWRSMWISFKR